MLVEHTKNGGINMEKILPALQGIGITVLSFGIIYLVITDLLRNRGKKVNKALDVAENVISTADSLMRKFDTDPSKDNKIEHIVKLAALAVKSAQQVAKKFEGSKEEVNTAKKEYSMELIKLAYKKFVLEKGEELDEGTVKMLDGIIEGLVRNEKSIRVLADAAIDKVAGKDTDIVKKN